MPQQTLIALSRVMIGIAWADGKVTSAELDLLKDLTFALPELSADDYDELNIYWMTPINHALLERLADDLLNKLHAEDAKAAAKNFLKAMVMADGTVTPDEAALLRDANRLIDREDPMLFQTMESLLMQALPKRRDHFATAGRGADYLADFSENRISSALKARFGDDIVARMGLEMEEIRKLGLTGALMGRVAYADLDVDDQEITLMHNILQSDWSLNPEHAELVVSFATDDTRRSLDIIRLTREFYEATTYSERLDLIDILFQIAHAHAGISEAETQEIAKIAAALKMDYADFEEARALALRREALLD